jgi:hypothetical protein
VECPPCERGARMGHLRFMPVSKSGPPAMRSVERSTWVELLIHGDIAFSFRGNRPEDFGGECKRCQPIGCDDGPIAYSRRSAIEFFTSVFSDMLLDEVLAVALMQTVVEQTAMSQSKSRSPDRSDRACPVRPWRGLLSVPRGVLRGSKIHHQASSGHLPIGVQTPTGSGLVLS